MKRYRVTNQSHYIGGRLVFPNQGEDSIVTLEPGVEPGRWLVEVIDEAQQQSSASSQDGYQASHVGAGNWQVLDPDGNRIGEMYRKADGEAKEKAEAAAQALNEGTAGGEPESGADLPDA